MFSNKDLTVKGNYPGFEFVPKKPTNQDVLLEKLKDVDYLVRRDMPDIPDVWFVPDDGMGATNDVKKARARQKAWYLSEAEVKK